MPAKYESTCMRASKKINDEAAGSKMSRYPGANYSVASLCPYICRPLTLIDNAVNREVTLKPFTCKKARIGRTRNSFISIAKKDVYFMH